MDMNFDQFLISDDNQRFTAHICQRYGEFVKLKIENMQLQHSTIIENAKKEEEKPAEPAKKKEPKKHGIIAVAAGDGLAEIFKGLGVDYIIEGGQTMNPSTEDMLNAIEKVNADTVFILPNNKNIILAANQAQTLVEDKQVVVIPTKTVPQGITAVINYVPDLSTEENADTMTEEIKNVKTGQVTYAVRDTMIDDKEIKEGDYMGIGDAGILSVGGDIDEITFEMISAMIDDDTELISIYYGEEVSEEDAEALKARIEEAYSSCDVELQFGGQPIYYYIVSAE